MSITDFIIAGSGGGISCLFLILTFFFKRMVRQYDSMAGHFNKLSTAVEVLSSNFKAMDEKVAGAVEAGKKVTAMDNDVCLLKRDLATAFIRIDELKAEVKILKS